MATLFGEAFEVARDIVAADHVEHDRDPPALGPAIDRVDEVGFLVVDGMGRAELDRGGALVVRAAGDDHLEPEEVAEQDRHRADAAGPAMDEDGVAVGGKAPLEQVDPHGEEGLGHGRSLGHAQDFGDGQAGATGGEAIFGIAAAGDEGADAAADRRAGRITDRDDGAGNFEPGDVGGAGRGGVIAHPLEDVGAVDAGGGDLDQHFAGAGCRHGTRHGFEDLRAAGLADLDRGHCCGNVAHAGYGPFRSRAAY